MRVTSIATVCFAFAIAVPVALAQEAKKPPDRPQRNEKLIELLDKQLNDGYKAMNLKPGDVPGNVNWCWNDRGTIGQDCGWNDMPWSAMSRHDIIAAACKAAVASDCKLAGQITDIAAKCQCHNPGAAQDLTNHPGETCTAVRKYDPCF